MALTRKFLAALGIEEDKIQEIITAHGETVSALKQEKEDLQEKLTAAQGNASKLADVQKELDELKKEDYKAKYETEKSAHDALKKDIADKATKSAKEAALKAYYESKNIKDGNLAIAMKGTDLEKIELDGEKIKDTKALDELVAGTFKPLVSGDPPRQQVIDSGGQLGGSKGQPAPDYSLAGALHEYYDKK